MHLRDPVLGIVVPGEMDQLSGTSARLKGLHNSLKAASTLRMMHTWIVLQIIGMIDETYIHMSSYGMPPGSPAGASIARGPLRSNVLQCETHTR